MKFPTTISIQIFVMCITMDYVDSQKLQIGLFT